MLVRRAHEIEWVRKSNRSISPIEYYERLKPVFEKENITFNGFVGEWKGNKTKLNLTCSEGHTYTQVLYHFQGGHRCNKCSIVKISQINAISKEDYYERLKPIFEKENIIFDGFVGEWKGCTTKLNLTCSEGHKFMPTIDSFQQGTRCPKCANIKTRQRMAISKEDYYERLKPIFEKENIIFDGFVGEWKGNLTKLNLICSEDHHYTSTIKQSLRGTRCPKCANIKTRQRMAISKEDYYERLKPVFEKENITFNGFVGEWKGNKTKLNLTCSEGHKFTPTIVLFEKGTRCPKCANIKKGQKMAISKEEYYERLKTFFIKENITFNGFVGEWKGNKTKLNLTCSEGHTYTQPIMEFQKGRRCPKCAHYGYNTLKIGTLYIQRLINNNNFVGVKFGITNLTTKARMKDQSRVSKFDHEVFYELTLQDGQKILDLENKIKEAMKGKTSYISKEDMPDGYTETVAPSELSTIMYIVKSFEKELTA